MSFLDNLENNLKALEGRDEGGADNATRREIDRKQARAAAPWAERLKTDPWTKTLMQQLTRAGFQRRIKVNMAWIGTTLRFESKGHRLELRPAADGINAVFGRGIDDLKTEKADLEREPAALIAEWIGIVEVQKKLDEEESLRIAEAEATD